MIGIHYSKRPASQRGDNLDVFDSFLIKEEWHRIDKLFTFEGEKYDDRMVASLYDNYPITTWEDENAIYVLEGIIYNIPEDSIRDNLKSVAESFSIEQVSRLVKEADGDFVIAIYKKKNKQVLFFNDELGGLPFHYYSDKDSFIAGRNCTYIAALSNEAEVSKLNMAELLCFNWNMSDRTIFKHIKSMNPAMFVQCDEIDGEIKVSTGQTIERSYSLTNPFQTKEEAIEVLKDLFLEGTKVRCEYAKSHGYAIVNTMSGGFDSRTVLGGIEWCIPSEEYINLTYEYDRDESEIANRVLNAMGSNSKYVKLHYDNSPNMYDAKLSFKTEGKISTYTNSVCYNDLMFSHENYFKGKRLLYFGGFGGEYIRHPLFESIWNASNIGGKTCPTLKDMSKLCGIRYKDAHDMVKAIFKDCNSSESFCKMFYDEYYRRYVRGAGEERIRMFYFSVQPLMSKSFILTIRNRVPLEWVGFEFYTDFLNAINPALTTVPRHGGRPNILSIRSLRKADTKNKSLFTNALKWFKYKYHVNIQKGKMEVESLLQLLDVGKIENMIDIKYLEKNFPNYSQHTQCKIAALLFYVNEIQK